MFRKKPMKTSAALFTYDFYDHISARSDSWQSCTAATDRHQTCVGIRTKGTDAECVTHRWLALPASSERSVCLAASRQAGLFITHFCVLCWTFSWLMTDYLRVTWGFRAEITAGELIVSPYSPPLQAHSMWDEESDGLPFVIFFLILYRPNGLSR